jgi:hypothetical protein
VQPEGSGKLKKLFSSSALEPLTFRFVVQCLNRYTTAWATIWSDWMKDQLEWIWKKAVVA